MPQILLWINIYESNADFLLMQQNVYRDEFFQYMPRAREVYDGHFPPGGIYANDNNPTPLNPITPLLFSFFIKLFRGDINIAYLSAQFLFAIIFFILFYYLGTIFLRSKIPSLFFSLVGTLTQIPQMLVGYSYIDDDYLGMIIKKFIPLVRTPISKMYFSRIDDPMLTLGFLILAILTTYLFWIKPTKINAIFAGLSIGLLAYVYLHYWLFMMVFIGLVFIYSLYNRTANDYKFKPVFLLCSTIFLVLIPYIVNYLRFNFSGYSSDYSLRLGKEIGRFLVNDYITNFSMGWTILVNYLFYFITLIAVYLFYFKKQADLIKKGVFFIGLIVTSFLVWYTPMITGFGFALFHFNKPISLVYFIIISSLLYDLFRTFFPTKSMFKSGIILFVVILSVSLVTKHIVNLSGFLYPPKDQIISYVFPGDIISSWKWVESNLSAESTVISDSLVTSLYLGSYTSSRPYLATGFLSTLSSSELERRFLIVNKLFDVPKEMLALRFKAIIPYDCSQEKCYKDTGINFDKSMWYLTAAGRSEFVFNKNLKESIDNYNNLVLNWENFNSGLVYLGPLEKQFSNPNFSAEKNLRLIYKNPSVEIYKIVVK
ncbi:MAG: hypothetical protein AAB911_01375 [Patescibacteria group bacterium]